MIPVFTCPKGHRWEAPPDQALPGKDGGPVVCPVCGARADFVCPTIISGLTNVAPAARKGESTSGFGAPADLAEPTVTLPGASSPSSRVGSYEIVRELGRGGMGVVYLARQSSLNRLVALKMILAGPHVGAVGLARFRREAEAVARLQHPNIVQIHEVGEHEGRPFFSLEYVAGTTLARLLGGTPQPAAEAAGLIETLARASHAAHEHGIIHRDLKPSNILLKLESPSKDDGGRGASETLFSLAASRFTPKITDFGLAKRVDEAAGPSLTKENIIGTPRYMAPEQAEGRARDVTPATDVYALGAILYELLTGRPPFVADTPLETLLLVIDAEPVPPMHLQPRVPLDLQTICLKCLEKDARKRYASALDLAEDLRRFQAGEPIEARPVSVPERLLKWTRRRPLAAALLAVCAVAAVSLFGMSLYFNVALRAAAQRERANAREAGEQRDEAERQRQVAVREREEAERQRGLARAQEAEAQRQRAEAVKQRDAADRQRRRAEANFRKARQAVDQMLSEVGQDWLAHVPQMTDVRQRLLEKALEFRKGFLEEQGDDPAVRREAGVGYDQLGAIYKMLRRFDEARDAHERAVALLGRLAAEFPGEPAYRRDLAAGYSHLGALFRDNSRFAEAEPAYRKALDLQGRLVAEVPGEPAHRAELAQTFNALAFLLRNTDRAERARQAYGSALALQEQLVAEFADRPEYREGLAGSLNDLGTLLRVVGDRAGAEKAFGRALEQVEQLRARFPDRPEYRQKLAATHNNLGVLGHEARQYDAAEKAHREALQIRARLVEDFPAVAAYQQDLAESRSNLAAVLHDRGQTGPAEELYREAIVLQKKLLARFGPVPDFASRLGAMLDNFAATLHDPKRLPEARQLLEEARPHHEAALQAYPEHPGYRLFFANHWAVLAQTALLQGNHAEAAGAAGELPRWRPDGPSSWRRSAGLLGRCAAAAGKDAALPEARRQAVAQGYAERAVQALREAVQRGCGDVDDLKRNPDLERLRGRPDFQELVQQLEERGRSGKP